MCLICARTPPQPPIMRKPETWSRAHCFHCEQHREHWPNTGSSACLWLRHKHLPLSAYTCIRVHAQNTRACTHAYINALQVNTRDILVSHKRKEPQPDSTVRPDSDLSAVLNFITRSIFILPWPPAVVVGHGDTPPHPKSIPLFQTNAVKTWLITRFWFMVEVQECPAHDWLLSVLRCHNTASCLKGICCHHHFLETWDSKFLHLHSNTVHLDKRLKLCQLPGAKL